MTTLARPARLELATGDAQVPAALLALEADGIIKLGDGLVPMVLAAHALYAEATKAGKRWTEAKDRNVDLEATDAIITAALRGRLDLAPADMVGTHLAEVVRLEHVHRVVAASAAKLSHNVQARIQNTARGIMDELIEALEHLLDEAAAPAAVLARVRLSYTDPGALLGAPPAVREAFAQLHPLAAIHDRIRAAGVALSASMPKSTPVDPCPPDMINEAVRLARSTGPRWHIAGGLAGFGVERTVMGGLTRWVFRPEGHPVERLVAAVSARNESMQLQEA